MSAVTFSARRPTRAGLRFRVEADADAGGDSGLPEKVMRGLGEPAWRHRHAKLSPETILMMAVPRLTGAKAIFPEMFSTEGNRFQKRPGFNI